MECLLGIDLGTSAVKLGLVSLDGRVTAVHSLRNEVLEPHPGWTEMEPESWWRGIVRGIRELCEKASVPAGDVRGVSFSVLYPALVCVGGDGECLRPAILYSDRRSVAQSQWLRDNLDPDRVLRITGNGTPTGTCSLTSMLWVKQNEPELFGRSRWLMHANGYLAFRFTGEAGMDWTNASLTGLFESGGGLKWSEELCRAAGIPRDKLPPLMPSSHCVGGVCASAAAETGLNEGTPVAIGAGDTAASTLGAGLLERGETLLTCGTTDNLSAVVDAPAFDRRFANCAYVVPDRWVLIGTMTNTGQALEWFRRNFYREGEDSYERIFEEAEAVEPGCGGVVFLPYLHGERSPLWDPLARGAFVGLKLTTDRGRMFRAVLEGVAFALRQNLEIMEGLQGGPIRRIMAVGGASKSAVWNRIKASVTGKTVLPLRFQETSLLGAAILAGVAAGVYEDVRSAVAQMRSPDAGDAVEPDPAARQTYDRMFALYRDLYPALKPAFHRLGE